MPLFDIDYDALIWQILPVRLRKAIAYSWLKCLAAPVIRLYNLFKVNRNTNLYALAHNSQVAYMEAALNDTFDPTGRGIYIADGPFEDPLFVYLVPESKPLWLGLSSEIGSTSYPDPEVLYTDGETSLLGIAFIVMVPVAVTFDTARMRALVDFYRLTGRNNYSIMTY
jgi:hypothetical protein